MHAVVWELVMNGHAMSVACTIFPGRCLDIRIIFGYHCIIEVNDTAKSEESHSGVKRGLRRKEQLIILVVCHGPGELTGVDSQIFNSQLGCCLSG